MAFQGHWQIVWLINTLVFLPGGTGVVRSFHCGEGTGMSIYDGGASTLLVCHLQNGNQYSVRTSE